MRIVLAPDPARARPRGVAARAADARHDRRRDPDAAGGVGRGALMLQRAGLPVCRRRPARGAARRASPCVSAMHAAGAKQATEHLLELGHRRIGAIAGSARAGTRRRSGWSGSAPRSPARGILLDPELVVYSDWRIPRGTEAADQLLSLPDPPTAIFGFNDNVAIGALHAARKRGLSVPDDLSVVGFDDTEPGGDRHAAADLGAPAARGDGADGRQPADAAHRRAARRRAAHGALDEARRARVDGAAAGV